MKKVLKIISNVLICLLIVIIIFFTIKRFNTYYNIEYNDVSKSAIHDFMIRNNVKLKDSKHITNITMIKVIPSGYTYTIYYIDSNNEKQFERISRKSENIFKDYIIQHGENLEQKYSNICKIAFYMLIIIIAIKSIIIYINNSKQKSLK